MFLALANLTTLSTWDDVCTVAVYDGNADGDPTCPSAYTQFTYIIAEAFLYRSGASASDPNFPPMLVLSASHSEAGGQQGDTGEQNAERLLVHVFKTVTTINGQPHILSWAELTMKLTGFRDYEGTSLPVRTAFRFGGAEFYSLRNQLFTDTQQWRSFEWTRAERPTWICTRSCNAMPSQLPMYSCKLKGTGPTFIKLRSTNSKEQDRRLSS